MKVLPLGTFGVILDVDWLEENNHKSLDQRAKHNEIQTDEGIVHLHGPPSTMTCGVINELQLQSLCHQGVVSHMVQLYQVELAERASIPPSVQFVVDNFSEVFGELAGLPPRRKCDHRIPMVPGCNLLISDHIVSSQSTKQRYSS